LNGDGNDVAGDGGESGGDGGVIRLSIVELRISVSSSNDSAGKIGGSAEGSSDVHSLSGSGVRELASVGKNGSSVEDGVVSNKKRSGKRVIDGRNSSGSKLISERILSIGQVEVVSDGSSSLDISRNGIEAVE